MADFHAPGLTADWLNAWLAAIGVTVVVPETRLRWSDDPRPHAAFSSGDTLIDDLVVRLPAVDDLAQLVIAKHHPGSDTELGQKIDATTYRDRAALARRQADATLAIVSTDLADAQDGRLPGSPFNPPVPKGLTLHDRVVDCRRALGDDPTGALAASLAGRGVRRKINGLGFDYRRILVASDPIGDKWADPVIELLAFCALTLLPSRGDGHHARFRGWTQPPSRRGAFSWPAWTPALTGVGIDALLDRFWRADDLPEVRRAYRSVPYRSLGSSDMTRGYASEAVV